MILIMSIFITTAILLFLLGFEMIKENEMSGIFVVAIGLIVVAFVITKFKEFYNKVNI